MSPDVLFKRFFAPIVGVLLALCAYLQASGTMQLVATSHLALEEKDLLGTFLEGGAAKATKAVPFRKNTSADVLIERNPFDSVTGPLNTIVVELPEDEPEKAEEELMLSDPLNAPDCSGPTVTIVTESTDPQWSVANIKGAGEPKAELRRVGDVVGDYEVQFIGYNPAKLRPAVWFTQGKKLCQAFLFPESEIDGKKAAAPAAPAAKAKTAAAPAAAAAGGGVPKEIQDKISKVSESEINIERSVIDHVLENQAALMKTARIVPEQQDGKTVGIRLFGIRPDTLLGVLGMQNGDRLETINGFNMASPETALQAYARLRSASNLSVQVTRRGKPLTIEYKIK